MSSRHSPILVRPLCVFVLATVFAASAALFMSVTSAHAEIDGNCEATIAGVQVAGVDSGDRGDDIAVDKDSQMAVTASSPAGFESHKIQLEFASRRWTVSDEQDDGSTSWSDTVNVDDYATYGVGLYKVVGVSTLADGTTCTGAATVDVSGNPLTTVAGGVAAGAAVVGTLGGLASATVAATRSPGPLQPYDEVWRGLDRVAEARPEEQAQDQAAREEEALQGITPTGLVLVSLGCVCFAALALIMTPLMALVGGAGGGADAPSGPPAATAGRQGPVQLPRAPWRPRITLLGLVSGLLAGAGAVVLMQQYSIEYPTLAVVLRTVLVVMAVYGIILPTIGYTIGWFRLNGRIARLEEELK